jgi:hypothetical protein
MQVLDKFSNISIATRMIHAQSTKISQHIRSIAVEKLCLGIL